VSKKSGKASSHLSAIIKLDPESVIESAQQPKLAGRLGAASPGFQGKGPAAGNAQSPSNGLYQHPFYWAGFSLVGDFR